VSLSHNEGLSEDVDEVVEEEEEEE